MTIHAWRKDAYGAPRIAVGLREVGEAINRDHAARLMHRTGFEGFRLWKQRPARPPAVEATAPDRLGRMISIEFETVYAANPQALAA